LAVAGEVVNSCADAMLPAAQTTRAAAHKLRIIV
jgi:hypothetical protein